MTKRISIRLNQVDYDYLVNRAVDKDMPIAYLVRELIKQDKRLFERGALKDGSISE